MDEAAVRTKVEWCGGVFRVVYRDGENVGWITSGGHGHTLGLEIGLGYVRRAVGVDDEFLNSGSYEIEIATRRFAATLHTQAIYDPENARIRG